MNQIAVKLQRKSYFPGRVVKGRVDFKLDKPIKARAMLLEITGCEATIITVSTGKHSHSIEEYRYIMRDKIYFRRPERRKYIMLEPGKYTNEFEFKIPNYAPASYRGINASISYSVTARVDVPWMSDLTRNKSFKVFRRKRDLKPFSRPISFQSKNYVNPKDDKPGFYVKLRRRGYRAGESIEGTIQLCNMEACKIRKVLIRLVGEEFAQARGRQEHSTIKGRQIKFSPERWTNETPVEFQIPISENISPGYKGMRSKLKWYVEAQLDLPFKRDIKAWCPVEIIR